MEDPAANVYTARLSELRSSRRALDARSSRISSLRGLTFAVAVGLAFVRAFRPVPIAVWIGAAIFAVAFIVLVVAHALLVTRIAEIDVRIGLLERGEKRIAGDIAGFPERGDRFVEEGHAYAIDLDVFGSSSLFQLTSAAETGPGEAMLARWLSAPADAAEIAARQEAVRELAPMARFREDIAARGVESGTKGRDGEPFVAWAEASGDEPSRTLMTLGRVLVAITMAALLAQEGFGLAPALRHVWVIPFVAQLIVYFVLHSSLAPILAPVASRESPFGRFVAIFQRIETERFHAPRLVRIHASIEDASRELGRLQTILGFAEVRYSGMLAVFLNVFLLWDVFCAAALLGWRARAGRSVRGWLAAMAEMEALASFAAVAYEQPSFTYPEVTEATHDGAGALHFVAERLAHPLIPASRRVANDVSLATPGTALMVTGSNMSGKSTLLRAVGVNAVLALAGAPVCAARLSMSTCRVWTSMRITDSLGEGVSKFYAELGRLKAVVDAADRGERVLFLLDEVLHGTNSRERNIGAKAVVVHLLEKGTIGAVSSHDLGLADLERETGGRVTNVHFQELVDGAKMTFDYRLKPGVVTSSNALRLMKRIGIAVDLPES